MITLNCAMTGEGGITTSSEGNSQDLKRFAKDVGAAMCGGCVFARMTLSEYHEYMAEAAAEEGRAIAEYRLEQTREAMAAGTYEPPATPSNTIPPSPIVGVVQPNC